MPTIPHIHNFSPRAAAAQSERAAMERESFEYAALYIEECLEKCERLFPNMQDDAELINDLQALASRAKARGE